MNYQSFVPSSNPESVYAELRKQRQSEADSHRREATRISLGRLAVFAVGFVVAWFTWGTPLLSPWWMTVPVVTFLGLVVVHDGVLRRWRREASAASFYERGLARLGNKWAGAGDSGERYLPASHPYALDLDLFGHGSLFELLSTATTSWGAKTLAEWLLSPVSPVEIRARQVAIEELRPRLDLREEIATLDKEEKAPPAQVDPDSLSRWMSESPVLVSDWRRYVAVIIGAASVTLVAAWLGSLVSRLPLLWVLLVEATFAFWLRSRVRRVIAAVEKPARDLAVLSKLLLLLERESFSSPKLISLQEALRTHGIPASRQVRSLRRLIDLLDGRRNQMFAPLAALMLWATQLAFAIEAWRSRFGGSVDRWLATTGELEALVSLASYSYEHPADPFPTVVDHGPLFEGEALGHPLIPEERVVRNDLRLGSDRRLLIVSGSNMSGKSTLLRTVGTNSVLACAGATVRARKLRLSPLAVGASIRIQDSLQGGISRFYAEILHLRQIMEMTEDGLPLLFLLDEILQGTNSHDRRIGADGLVRGLVERGAVGLITTHDLALAKIADSLAPAAANVHFEDHLEGGKMTFSYQMQSGVVQKSNALALMRAVGLKV